MEKELVEHSNVYNQKIDPDRYREVLNSAIIHEYNKSLVLFSLAEGEGRQVRQIAQETGLDLHTISDCLVELEHGSLAGSAGYDGQHPKFIRTAV